MPRRGALTLHLVGLLVIALLAGCAGSASPVATPPLPPALVGTWTGTHIEPEGRDTKNWLMTLTILPCAVKEPCGDLEYVGHNAKGDEISCGYALTYTGMSGDEYLLSEQITWNRGPFAVCASSATLYVTPMPDGTLDEREHWEGRFGAHGTLHRVDGS
jgi:hypothetical protein